MTPKELSNLIGVDSKLIRKFARKRFGKSEGSWNFTDIQVDLIKAHFTGSQTELQKKAAATVATPVRGNAKLEEAVRKGNPDYDWNTEAGLTQYAKNWLKETYGLELEVPIKINARLTRALGHFKYYISSGKPHSISIAKRTVDYYGKEATLDVLKHELVHYACFVLGKPHEDGDWYFENELKKHGITRTNTYKRKGEFHTYYCPNCGNRVSARPRQINPQKLPRYYSKCCGVQIQYKGKEYIED